MTSMGARMMDDHDTGFVEMIWESSGVSFETSIVKPHSARFIGYRWGILQGLGGNKFLGLIVEDNAFELSRRNSVNGLVHLATKRH